MSLRIVVSAALAALGLAVPLALSHAAAPAPTLLEDRIVGGPSQLDAFDAAARTAAATDTRTPPASEAAQVRTLDVEVATSHDGLAMAPTAPGSTGRLVADAVSGGRVQSATMTTGDFQTLGLTWPDGADVAGLDPQVRTRSKGGTWTDWTALPASDNSPDAGTPDAERAKRGGTDSLWVGDSDAVQVSFAADRAAKASGLELALVDVPPIPAAAAQSVGTAWSGQAQIVPAVAGLPTLSQPRIISREQWGARPQVCQPAVADDLVGVVVHHTADSNDYSTVAEAMQKIRGDQAYHIDGRGWCDIGYNFIVDKWGNIYEGRDNSLTEPVIGVHAGGFNTGTVGISMLGTYSAAPPQVTQEAVATLVAWRLREYHRDPTATMRYYTYWGENSRFDHQWVTLPRVLGHRDVAYTACPGQGGYEALPWIRTRAKQLIGPSFIDPTAPKTVASGQPVTLTASTIGDLSWSLTVRDPLTGYTFATNSGVALQSDGGLSVTWDGTNGAGLPVGAGTYSMYVTGTDQATGARVVPIDQRVVVTRTDNPPTVDPVPLVGDLTFHAITPQRVLDTRPSAQSLGPRSRADVKVAGVGDVPADAKAVSVTLTAVAASTATFLTVWPAGADRPLASILNADAHHTVPASTIVGVGGQGMISVYNASGSVHVVVDVTGYWSDDGAGDLFTPLPTATRLYDSRTSGGQFASGETRTLTVAGVDGVPADATAAMLNVVSVGAKDDGYVSVVPHGSDPTLTSTVNNVPGGDAANRSLVPLSGGQADVYLRGGAADVVVDVVGWVGPSGSYRFTPVQPVRAFDTRDAGAPLTEGEQRTFQLRDAVGAADAQLALVNLTATQETAPATYLTVWPGGSDQPGTSDLNASRGRDQANATVVGWDSGGEVTAYNARGSTHLIADVYGFFR
ncbi:N-acetylmuramoyl-L-alanine amidase [Isoptericola sp. b490]|uniref:N-acetylmuramoyl-L-alanine amidase n=1 Tax=Actinotalea lenta TaxID=3064654 RepID=UPI0027139F36|nr:N-acetylmuramoyl-L-alanine amidase [Isoptericola sp. b490]MDO8119958.1 N-acetylmuramoyl-L-alanine amidase [Isoptericola sp. b490]